MRKIDTAPFTLPLEQILEDRNFNVRIFYGDIDQLAIQLMTEGQLEPVKVRCEGDQFFLVDGHRRQRAFARSRHLRIALEGGKHMVFEGDRPLREAPGPVHENYDPGRIQCWLVDDQVTEADLFASQLTYNCGKPFTLLERMIFLSRLSRLGNCTREQLALKTGFSRTHIANAQNLNSADPRLLEYVREGRISQKLALRLLRALPAEEQIVKACAALAEAERNHREKILPKDFDWGAGAAGGGAKAEAEPSIDRVRARLQDLASRLGDAVRFAPNPVAQERLGTWTLVHRYATGKLSYARLEAHLLGRE
jgi:ParB-like chromosome segregation protein Spo0J